MRFSIGFMAIMVTLSASAAAQGGSGTETAFARAQHLRHGINASEWFAQSGEYSAARTNRYTDAQDIALMARLGFDHVRLSIDAAPLDASLQALPGGGSFSVAPGAS